MSTILLPHGIELVVEGKGTAITCSEMSECPGCKDSFCYMDCDASYNTHPETDDDARIRLETNCRIEGMLFLIQNLHARGVQVNLEDHHFAIESTFDDIANIE